MSTTICQETLVTVIGTLSVKSATQSPPVPATPFLKNTLSDENSTVTGKRLRKT